MSQVKLKPWAEAATERSEAICNKAADIIGAEIGDDSLVAAKVSARMMTTSALILRSMIGLDDATILEMVKEALDSGEPIILTDPTEVDGGAQPS